MGWCGVSTAGIAPNRIALHHFAVSSDVGLTTKVDEFRGCFGPRGGRGGEVCLGQPRTPARAGIVETIVEVVVLVGQAAESRSPVGLNEKTGNNIAAREERDMC